MPNSHRWDDATSRFHAQYVPEPNSGCWLWTGIDNGKGYPRMGVRGRRISAHRISYELHKGAIPAGMSICHHCDVRCCVNPNHLFVGTLADNAADMVAKDRQARGRRVNTTKLTEEQVRQIRKLAAEGLGPRALERMFPVNHSTIQLIVRRKTWRHVA